MYHTTAFMCYYTLMTCLYSVLFQYCTLFDFSGCKQWTPLPEAVESAIGFVILIIAILWIIFQPDYNRRSCVPYGLVCLYCQASEHHHTNIDPYVFKQVDWLLEEAKADKLYLYHLEDSNGETNHGLVASLATPSGFQSWITGGALRINKRCASIHDGLYRGTIYKRDSCVHDDYTEIIHGLPNHIAAWRAKEWLKMHRSRGNVV